MLHQCVMCEDANAFASLYLNSTEATIVVLDRKALEIGFLPQGIELKEQADEHFLYPHKDCPMQI